MSESALNITRRYFLGQCTGVSVGAMALNSLLMAGLVVVTLWRGARVKRALAAQEERMKRDG